MEFSDLSAITLVVTGFGITCHKPGLQSAAPEDTNSSMFVTIISTDCFHKACATHSSMQGTHTIPQLRCCSKKIPSFYSWG